MFLKINKNIELAAAGEMPAAAKTRFAVPSWQNQKPCQAASMVGDDPWGNGYKIAKNKISKVAPALRNVMIEKAAELFPAHAEVIWQRRKIGAITQFIMDEPRSAIKKTKINKNGGPDGVAPEVAKIILKTIGVEALTMYNSYLLEGFFPTGWEELELLLLPKSAGTFKPICLLNVFGKIYERLLVKRIEA